jgi:Anti-sigma factor NepR
MSKTNEKSSNRSRKIRSEARLAIGGALRAHYDELVRTPIPQTIHQLLARLEARNGSAFDKQGQG